MDRETRIEFIENYPTRLELPFQQISVKEQLLVIGINNVLDAYHATRYPQIPIAVSIPLHGKLKVRFAPTCADRDLLGYVKHKLYTKEERLANRNARNQTYGWDSFSRMLMLLNPAARLTALQDTLRFVKKKRKQQLSLLQQLETAKPVLDILESNNWYGANIYRNLTNPRKSKGTPCVGWEQVERNFPCVLAMLNAWVAKHTITDKQTPLTVVSN